MCEICEMLRERWAERPGWGHRAATGLLPGPRVHWLNPDLRLPRPVSAPTGPRARVSAGRPAGLWPPAPRGRSGKPGGGRRDTCRHLGVLPPSPHRHLQRRAETWGPASHALSSYTCGCDTAHNPEGEGNGVPRGSRAV